MTMVVTEPVLIPGGRSQVQSRSSRRKALARGHTLAWTDEIVCALNSMYAGSEFVANTDGQKHCRPSLSQRQSVQRIFSLVKRLGKPPSEVTGQGALNELRAKLGYDGQPSTLAQLQVDPDFRFTARLLGEDPWGWCLFSM